jgi:hypothetical protein
MAALRGVGTFALGGGIAAAVGAAAASWEREERQGSGVQARELPQLPWCADAVRTFATQNAPGPRETLAVQIADVDADGHPDALYTNQLDESFTVWWGRSDGRPHARMNIPAGRSSHPVQVHDFDGDGHKDVLLSLSDDSAFAVVRGLGERRFAPPERMLQGPSPRESRVFSTRAGPGVLFIAGQDLYLRPLATTFPWPTHRILGTLGPGATHAVFARQGDTMLVATWGGAPALFSVDDEGNIRSRRTPVAWPAMRWVFSADLTLDGDDEIYGTTLDDKTVRLPVLDGETPCMFASSGTISMLLGHLDADGLPDAVAAETCTACTSNHILLWGQGG